MRRMTARMLADGANSLPFGEFRAAQVIIPADCERGLRNDHEVLRLRAHACGSSRTGADWRCDPTTTAPAQRMIRVMATRLRRVPTNRSA